MKKVVLWAIALLWMSPAMLCADDGLDSKNNEEKEMRQVEQKQEHEQAPKTLEEKTLEKKQAAIQQRRENQLAENKGLQQAMHDKQAGELKTRLAQNTKLTETQKNEILAAREKQYQKNMVFGDQRRAENDVFFQKIGGDSGMTEEQKRGAIRAHFQSQRPADQVFRQQQKVESKAEREKMRSEATTNSTSTVAQ